jgi:hypothetical protein
MSNLVWKPAVELAQMIRGSSASRSVRHISAIELLDAHLEQITQHNSKLNAICTLDEENARIHAKQADEALARGENWGALHGVPMTIKDIFETLKRLDFAPPQATFPSKTTFLNRMQLPLPGSKQQGRSSLRIVLTGMRSK